MCLNRMNQSNEACHAGCQTIPTRAPPWPVPQVTVRREVSPLLPRNNRDPEKVCALDSVVRRKSRNEVLEKAHATRRTMRIAQQFARRLVVNQKQLVSVPVRTTHSVPARFCPITFRRRKVWETLQRSLLRARQLEQPQ